MENEKHIATSTPPNETRVTAEFGVLQRKENERLEMMKKNKSWISWRLVISAIVFGALLLLFFCVYSVVFSLSQSRNLPNIDVAARLQHPEPDLLLEETIVETFDRSHQPSEIVVSSVETFDRNHQPTETVVSSLETNSVDALSTLGGNKVHLVMSHTASDESGDAGLPAAPAEIVITDNPADTVSASTTETSVRDEAPQEVVQPATLEPNTLSTQSGDATEKYGVDGGRLKLSSILERLMLRFVPVLNQKATAQSTTDTSRFQPSIGGDMTTEDTRQSDLLSHLPNIPGNPKLIQHSNRKHEESITATNQVNRRPYDEISKIDQHQSNQESVFTYNYMDKGSQASENQKEPGVLEESRLRSENAPDPIYRSNQHAIVIEKERFIPGRIVDDFRGRYDSPVSSLNRVNDNFDSLYHNDFTSRLRPHYNHFFPADRGHIFLVNPYGRPLSGLASFRIAGSGLPQGSWSDLGRRAKALNGPEGLVRRKLVRNQLSLRSDWPGHLSVPLRRSSANLARGLGFSSELPYRLPYNLLPSNPHPGQDFDQSDVDPILSE